MCRANGAIYVHRIVSNSNALHSRQSARANRHGRGRERVGEPQEAYSLPAYVCVSVCVAIKVFFRYGNEGA